MTEWYVAKVKQQNEQTLQVYLGQYGVATYAPEIIVIKQGKHCMELLFPGCVFVRADPLSEMWRLVRWARGLSYFLPAQGQPEPVEESTIGEIRSRVEQWNAGDWVTMFQPGDRVMIDHGPLRTLGAIFQRYIDGKRRCEILVSLMERPHRVKVDVTELQSFTGRQGFAGLLG